MMKRMMSARVQLYSQPPAFMMRDRELSWWKNQLNWHIQVQGKSKSDAAKQRRRGEEATLQSKGDEARKRRCKAKETRRGTTLQSKGDEARKRRCKAKETREEATLQSKGDEVRKRRCKAKETGEEATLQSKGDEVRGSDAAKQRRRGEETTLQSKGDEARKRRCKAKETRRGNDAAKQRRRAESSLMTWSFTPESWNTHRYLSQCSAGNEETSRSTLIWKDPSWLGRISPWSTLS
ncbi:hypothetical protein F7725_024694 [Dissostichus mawsoni]|uniref:Uncharacterized protein n=1 Tax=Dissostichus mawsoni TaxID=36200 RepID=A0A7J5X912_DISMA|nr:hypothetical protein F7725_024694 [Dissostichus mawsoni]